MSPRRPLPALAFALSLAAALSAMPLRAAESHYRLVENWAQFPPGVTFKWEPATGGSYVDSRDNVYVFHRNDAMPVMVFDRHGKFLRAWGQGMFKTTHFLRVDPSGNIWITDRGNMVGPSNSTPQASSS